MPYSDRRKRLTYGQVHYRRNRKKRILESVAYYRKHKKRIKLDRAKVRRKNKPLLKAAVLKHYCGRKIGCQCKGCPIKHSSLLTVDHKKSIGHVRQKSLFGQNMHAWIVAHKFPSGFQILCWACNGAKGSSTHCPRRGKSH